MPHRKSAALVTHLALLLPLFILSACGGGTPESQATGSAGTPSLGGGTGTGTGSGGSGGNVAPTGSYVLSWDAVADPRVTGYKVYYSSSPFTSTVPPRTVDTGSATTYLLSPGTLGISAGTTVYVAVAATQGSVESPLSDTVSVVVQ